MATEKQIYDLTLLLDPEVDENLRSRILEDVEELLAHEGELLGRHDWGLRATTFPINKRESAHYHLFQFNGSKDLLSHLEHSLKITDGVLRHRVIKVTPGTPAPPQTPSPAASEEKQLTLSARHRPAGPFVTKVENLRYKSAQTGGIHRMAI